MLLGRNMCYGEFRIFVTVDLGLTLRANFMAACMLQVHALFPFCYVSPRLWSELPKELNFASLFMMCPCHCHFVFLSPVHHHHHHYHHFHCASFHLCSTPELTFSINPSHYSVSHLFGRISWTFMTIS